MAKPLTVVARIRAKAGKEEEVREALLTFIEPTRAEAGCVNYDLHRSLEDPALFLFHENWVSQEALHQHLQMPHIQAVVARAEELLDGPVDITLWEGLD